MTHATLSSVLNLPDGVQPRFEIGSVFFRQRWHLSEFGSRLEFHDQVDVASSCLLAPGKRPEYADLAQVVLSDQLGLMLPEVIYYVGFGYHAYNTIKKGGFCLPSSNIQNFREGCSSQDGEAMDEM